MTTYKSQGQTYDKVVVEADTSAPQLQDQRNTYVQITRARDDVRVFTDDQAGLREVSAILNYKTDTFGVDATLEQATAMERRVHVEAFGDRAQREAVAKIVQAEAAAKRDAENVVDMEKSKYLPPETPHVDNEVFVAGAKGDEAESARRIDQLRKIDEALHAHRLSDGEKGWTADYLNSDEAVTVLERLKQPEAVIAVGLVKARVMDLDEALKGLSMSEEIAVKIHFRNEEIDKKRDLGKGLEKDGPGFDLSL
jgi:hypothetical protein